MTPRLELRPARWADRTAVVELVRRMGGHDGAEPAEIERAFARALDDPTVRAIVAVAGWETLGYAEVQARTATLDGCWEAWLAALAVAPEARRRGIGMRLVEAADHAAALLGCDRIVLESSEWRSDAHRFYTALGFVERAAPALRYARPVARGHGDLVDRFLAAASRAATAVSGAVAGFVGRNQAATGHGAGGDPSLAADLAAEAAAAAELGVLSLPILSEESGAIGRAPEGDEPWIALDPLDGSRNLRRGLPPWATAMGLVVDGRAAAGLVCDLSSGRRWSGALAGAAPSSTAVGPSPERAESASSRARPPRAPSGSPPATNGSGSRGARPPTSAAWPTARRAPSSTSTEGSPTSTTSPGRWPSSRSPVRRCDPSTAGRSSSSPTLGPGSESSHRPAPGPLRPSSRPGSAEPTDAAQAGVSWSWS